METTHFVVRRDLKEHDLAVTPRGTLAPGQAELRVDLFGFTAINVSYGLLGETQSYWRFFPEARQGWGRLPVWGFGTVVRSSAERVYVGERFYGYFPMSSHLVVQPKRADDAGFFDSTSHRRDLSALFNHYVRTSGDPSYLVDGEPQQSVLRPLFGTSYFLADYLREHGYFDAEVTIVTSASSKVACAMAFCLAAEAKRNRRTLVGLTSERNLEFVTRLGLYDRVLTYDDVASLPSARRAALVDVAGNMAVLAAIHRHLGSSLRASLMVGATHQDLRSAPPGISGPEPVPFFAPAWIRQRNKQWTPEGVRRRLADAWRSFIVPMLDPSRSWLSIVSSVGPEAVGRAFGDVVGGRARPDQGHVFSL